MSSSTNHVGTSDEVRSSAVLGPFEMGGGKRPHVRDALTSKKRSKSSLNNDIVDDSNLNDISVTLINDSIKDSSSQLTLGQRLDSLSSDLLELENRYDLQHSYNKDLDTRPTADSLVVLIEQALQSGDDILLEQCFECHDIEVIESTTKRLPPGRVLQLLRRLVAKFEKRPSRGVLLTRWLSSVLKNHTSYLISIPDLAGQLAGLSQMLEQRLSSYRMLVSLGGRLDLLMSQISASSSDSRSSPVTPTQTYIEEE